MLNQFQIDKFHQYPLEIYVTLFIYLLILIEIHRGNEINEKKSKKQRNINDR